MPTNIIIWFVSGAILAPISFALTLGDWYGNYGHRENAPAKTMAFLTFICPLQIITVFCLSGFAEHGLKWK